MNGTENSRNNATDDNQNMPRIFTGLKLRDNNIPKLNGNNILSVPPKKLTLSNVQPTPMFS